MTQDDFVNAEQNGIISFEFSARVQDEIAHLRSELEQAHDDIARKYAALIAIKNRNKTYTRSCYIDEVCETALFSPIN